MPTDLIMPQPRSAGETWAWSVWLILLVVLGTRPLLKPRTNTVYPIYAQASADWCAGKKMYGLENRPAGLDHFRYAPVFAVAFLPLHVLPEGLGELLWRLLNGGVFLTGFVGFAREFLGDSWQRSSWHRTILLWLLLPLSIGSLNNGQVNPLMVGLLLLTMTSVAKQRWNLAAFCLTVSIFCKLYPVSLALLLVLWHPRQLGGRLLFGLALGLGLPFLAQSPGYVIGEYQHWLNLGGVDGRQALSLGQGLRDLNMLLQWCGLILSRLEYLSLQLTAALALATFSWWGRNGNPSAKQHLRLIYDLACLWMILLGPATESCTYILLAPTLACALMEGLEGKNRRSLVLLGPALCLFVGSVVGTGFAMPKIWTALAQVLGAILLLTARIAEAMSLAAQREGGNYARCSLRTAEKV
jgi:hypothetical protein